MKRISAWGQHIDDVHVLKPRVLIIDRCASALLYLHEGANGDDYDACVQIEWHGETAHLHSLTGSGFYLAWEQFSDLLRQRGVKEITAEVREPHARLIERLVAKHGGDMARTGSTQIKKPDGSSVCLVKIRVALESKDAHGKKPVLE